MLNLNLISKTCFKGPAQLVIVLVLCLLVNDHASCVARIYT